MSEVSELVKKAANGDRTAFDGLYKQTRNGVWFTCISLLKNEENAKDIMQDVYVTALEKLGTLEKPESVQSWLNRIAANKCKNYILSKANTAFEDNGDELLENIPDDELCPEEYVTNAAKRAIIMDIIEKSLSVEQYRTIILYYFDELTAPEIAELMGVHEKTVQYRLKTARLKIKEEVMRYEKENNDKLYAAVPLPFLTRLLRVQAENISVPDVPIDVNIPKELPKAESVPSNTAANSAANIGGKTLLNTLKSKIIAGACAAVVVGGGVTGIVIATNSNKQTESKPVVSTVSSATSAVSSAKANSVKASSAKSTVSANSVASNAESNVKLSEEDLLAEIGKHLGSNQIVTREDDSNGSKEYVPCTKITVTPPEKYGITKTERSEYYNYISCDGNDNLSIIFSVNSGTLPWNDPKEMRQREINNYSGNADDTVQTVGEFTADNDVVWYWENLDLINKNDDGTSSHERMVNFYARVPICENDVCLVMVNVNCGYDDGEKPALNEKDYFELTDSKTLKFEKYDPNAEPTSEPESEPTTSSEPEKPVKVDINTLDWDKIPYADENDLDIYEYDDGRQSVLYRGSSNVIKLPPEIDGIKLKNLHLSFPVDYSVDNIEAVYVPDGVTELNDVAFAGYMSGLKKIRLPESLTKLGDGVFGYCSSLTEIDLPDGITEIGREDFADCAVKNLKLPKSLKTLGPRQFEGHHYSKTLESVSFPGSLKIIEDRSFYDCVGLKTITFEEGLEEIGHEAFFGCESLTEVKLPNSLKKIGLSAFGACKNATFTYKGVTYTYEQMRDLEYAIES